MTLLVELGIAFALGVLAGTLMTVHYGAAYRLKERRRGYRRAFRRIRRCLHVQTLEV
jgi:hypothetical protein